MSSSCKSSTDCVDPHGPEPVRATYVSLYGWPESDAEFMRSVTRRREAKSSVDHRDTNTNNRWRRAANSTAGPAVVDSYWCRQTYLRSYTFSRKESTRERTRRCFVRVKEKVSLLAFLWRRRKERKKKRAGGCTRNKRSNKSGGCFVLLGEIRKLYCAASDSIFRSVVTCSVTIGLRSRSRRRYA